MALQWASVACDTLRYKPFLLPGKALFTLPVALDHKPMR